MSICLESFPEGFPGPPDTLEVFDPVLVADALEDYVLRKAALPLHPLDWTPVVRLDGHPAYPAVCDVCGSLNMTLSHCGRPLCIPCQRKRVSKFVPIAVDAALLVLDELALLHREHNKSYRLRFVGLTLKNVPLETLGVTVGRIQKAYQKLRRRRFWKDCEILGDLPSIEWTYCLPEWGLRLPGADWSLLSSPTWHVHLHAVTAGGFIPAGPERAREGEGNLRDEWLSLTGDSMIVDVEAVEDPREAIDELVKYLFKPTDDAGHSILGWPDEVRREAAEVVAGPHRTTWYCQSHRSRDRSKCLERWIDTPVGCSPWECTGDYRLERQGFRPLVPTGIIRKSIRRAKHERDARPSNCPTCGLGNLHAKSYWSARARAGSHADELAEAALNLIQDHETTGMPASQQLNLLAEMPAGWHPPPPYENFRPALRAWIVLILGSGALGIERIVDVLESRLDTLLDRGVVQLAVWSLRSLGVIWPDGYQRFHLNEEMLQRLTGARSSRREFA